MARVKNTTASTITLDVEGKRHRIGPGKSVTVTPREALILGEYDGLEVDDRRKAIEAQDIPAPQEETRRTGGRQHVIDDPRKNMPGVPVTVTGDTGSTTPEPGTQGVSAAEHAGGDPNEVRTPEGDNDPDGADALAWVDELKGGDLEAALKAAELSTAGTADEKRARLREHHSAS